MRTVLLILGALSVAGCTQVRTPTAGDTSKIAYSQDSRTDLCFASTKSVTYGMSQVVSITNVPCSPAVLGLVQ